MISSCFDALCRQLPISGEVRGKEGAAAPKRGDVTRKYRHDATKMGTRTWTNKKLGMFFQRVWGDLTNGLGFHEETVKCSEGFLSKSNGEVEVFTNRNWDYQMRSRQNTWISSHQQCGEHIQRGPWVNCKVGPRPPVFRGGLGLGINHQWFVLIWSILSIILSITAQFIPPYSSW